MTTCDDADSRKQEIRPPMASTYDRFASTEAGRAALERACTDFEVGPEVVKYCFDLFDKTGGSLTGQFAPMVGTFRPQFDNTGRERGHGRFVGYESIGGALGKNGEIDDLDSSELDDLVESIMRHANREALKIEHPPEPVQAQVSKEALRKRKARAEGRVKPRAKRPARTLADEIASRQKSVETREAQVTAEEQALALTADLSGVRYRQLASMKEGLRRAKRALETYKRRLARSSAPDS